MDSVARTTRTLAVVAALLAVVAAVFCAQRTASAITIFAHLGAVLPEVTVTVLYAGDVWRTVPGWIVTFAALVITVLPPFLLGAHGRRARRAYALAIAGVVSAVVLMEASLELPLRQMEVTVALHSGRSPRPDWLLVSIVGVSAYLLPLSLFLASEWLRLVWHQARLPAEENAGVEVTRAIVIGSVPAAVLGAIAASALPSSFDPGPIAPLLRADLAAGGTVALAVVLAVVFVRARRTEARREEP